MPKCSRTLQYEAVAEDSLAKLLIKLAWVAEIGFAELDVIWKYYNFAVYGGVKR